MAALPKTFRLLRSSVRFSPRRRLIPTATPRNSPSARPLPQQVLAFYSSAQTFSHSLRESERPASPSHVHREVPATCRLITRPAPPISVIRPPQEQTMWPPVANLLFSTVKQA